MVMKYCEIVNEKTGLVMLGAGCSDEYYEEIGMVKRDVKQSDIDYEWYLTARCPMKTEAQKEREEKERIARLNMTKQDFFNYVLKPNEFTYDKLMAIVNSSEDYKVAWNLCERVYRGDENLVGALTRYLPHLTEKDLDNLFEQYGANNNV